MSLHGAIERTEATCKRDGHKHRITVGRNVTWWCPECGHTFARIVNHAASVTADAVGWDLTPGEDPLAAGDER